VCKLFNDAVSIAVVTQRRNGFETVIIQRKVKSGSGLFKYSIKTV
jgi:hypothetical protein